MNDIAVVLMSGGIDSATCMGLACRAHGRIKPVFVRYGQQTESVEQRMAANQITNFRKEYPNVAIDELNVINYWSVFAHFAEGVVETDKTFEEETEDDGRSSGYVPMRNLHLIASAAGIADSMDAEAVYHGAQNGDAADYPDCRVSFIDAAMEAVNRSLPEGQTIDVLTPLIDLQKHEVIERGAEVGVDFAWAYSCYRETDISDPNPCGECPACVERSEAFAEVDINDPYGVEA